MKRLILLIVLVALSGCDLDSIEKVNRLEKEVGELNKSTMLIQTYTEDIKQLRLKMSEKELRVNELEELLFGTEDCFVKVKKLGDVNILIEDFYGDINKCPEEGFYELEMRY